MGDTTDPRPYLAHTECETQVMIIPEQKETCTWRWAKGVYFQKLDA